MRMSMIVAMSENRVIGKDNQLPWRLPADLRHFKNITLGKSIVLGRKTYESIGRPLPDRQNIILSHDPSFQASGCVVVDSIEAALLAAGHVEEIFIIGGARLYEQLLPITQKLYLTLVHTQIEGDAYFPEINSLDWKEAGRVDYSADSENPYPYSFMVLERIYS